MKFVKMMLVVFLVFALTSCRRKSQTIFLEKDGTLYEIANDVSFYYPKEFTLSMNQGDRAMLQFVLNEETFMYQTVEDDTDNVLSDLPRLFAGQLEEDGAKDVQYTSILLESGLECYSFTGEFSSMGIKFKHIVYFTDQKVYDYSYQAPVDVYNDQINIRTQYLESLTVHH